MSEPKRALQFGDFVEAIGHAWFVADVDGDRAFCYELADTNGCILLAVETPRVDRPAFATDALLDLMCERHGTTMAQLRRAAKKRRGG